MKDQKINDFDDLHITCAGFSFDGKYLATGSQEGILQIWNVKENFSNIITKQVEQQDIKQIAFSVNGKYILATNKRDMCQIWNFENNFELIKTIKESYLLTASFSPCGKYLVYTTKGDCFVLNMEKNFELQKTINELNICSVAFSEKGEHLITISQRSDNIKYQKWNVENNFEQIEIYTTSSQYHPELSNDGKLLAITSQDNILYIKEFQEKMHQRMNWSNKKQIYSLSFSPDGKYLAACQFGQYQIWNIKQNFELICNIREQKNISTSDFTKSMAFSPDGKYFVYCFGNSKFKVWNTANDFELIYTIENELKKESQLYYLISHILNYILYVIYPIPLSVSVTIFAITQICDIFKKIKGFFILLWFIISSYAVVYFLFSIFFLQIENEVLLNFQLDGIFFYLSSTLVLSYLKTNYHYPYKSIKSILRNIIGQKDLFSFLYSNTNDDQQGYFFDFKKEEIINILNNDQAHSDIPEAYAFFYDYFDRTSFYFGLINHNNLDFYFFRYLQPNFSSFFLLAGIFLLKMIFCFCYIISKVSDISEKQYLDMIIIIFVYIFTSFNLNRILGNYDLRRKYLFMVFQNQLIDFQYYSKNGLEDKLDFTSPKSIEAWDNIRKRILTYQKDWLATLELSYFCLFLYYILVTLIDLSAYFEFYWIIPSGSVLLSPIIVIMCTFNFIFLSAFFLFRFYEGSKFNDSFEDLTQSLDLLIDILEDLLTMFDCYFDQNRLTNIKSEQPLIYIEIVKKVNKISEKIIQDQTDYEGRKYVQGQISKLKKNILQNIKLSLEKVKKSVNIDSNLHKYKFLNLIEINFKDIFFGLLFAIITTLPAIIPKFVNLYNHDKNN